MSDVKSTPITSPTSINLLEQIKSTLSRIKLRPEDGYGNREYERNKALNEQITQLLVDLGIGVRDKAIYRLLQLLRISRI